MKWKYETKKSYIERINQWHPWFTWYPVSCNGTTYWLETVERRGEYRRLCDDIIWEYREIKGG